MRSRASSRWRRSGGSEVLIALGASLIALFLGLRLINTYGDPMPWTAQSDYLRTLMSFLNVKKYPPSLDYLLVTIGPALMLLACLENVRGRFANAATGVRARAVVLLRAASRARASGSRNDRDGAGLRECRC